MKYAHTAHDKTVTVRRHRTVGSYEPMVRNAARVYLFTLCEIPQKYPFGC
jgi:hypothetical protein